jgi:hypothetical protein
LQTCARANERRRNRKEQWPTADDDRLPPAYLPSGLEQRLPTADTDNAGKRPAGERQKELACAAREDYCVARSDIDSAAVMLTDEREWST